MWFKKNVLSKSIAGTVYPKLANYDAVNRVRARINHAVKKSELEACGWGEDTTIELAPFLRWAIKQKGWDVLKGLVKYPIDFPKIEVTGIASTSHSNASITTYIGGMLYEDLEQQHIQILTEHASLKREVKILKSENLRLEEESKQLKKNNYELMTASQKRRDDGAKPDIT